MKNAQAIVAVRRTLQVGATALLMNICLSTAADAQLTIVRNFQGGAAPGNLAGGGDLVTLFNAGADWWERTLCSPAHTVTINYRWGSLSPGVLGSHTLQSQGGNPNRETQGRITFDGDGSNLFFADPTPGDQSEYSNFLPLSQNLGGGNINTARYWNGASGAAVGRIDLYSVVLHEIGHALGLSSANQSFQAEAGGDNDVDVTNPRPLPGSVIPTTPGSAHLNVFRALMFPSIGNGARNVPSGVDVLTNGQLSKFTEMLLAAPNAGSSNFRNGGGSNPAGFVETNSAAIGQTWSTTVDLSNGANLSIVFIGLGGPTTTATAFGELLVNGPLKTTSIAAGVHNSAIPLDCSFVGFEVPAQAATLGPPPIQLQNALDLRVGAF